MWPMIVSAILLTLSSNLSVSVKGNAFMFLRTLVSSTRPRLSRAAARFLPSPTVVENKWLPLEPKGSSYGREWDNHKRSATMGGGTEQHRTTDRRTLCPSGTAPAGAGVSARFIEPARTQKWLAVGGRGGRSHSLWSSTFIRGGAVGVAP